uniref:Ig-like domain-containing protein n=1 Tax=Oryzias latipes TaxID=8090 RepID=A0A3P9H6K5_ORYLA
MVPLPVTLPLFRLLCLGRDQLHSLTSSSPPLVKPSISMDPVGEVSWGQELRITCSTAAELLGETFFLQMISGSFRKTQISASRAATFTISKVNFDHDGSYQCHYEKTVSVSGQTFTSPLSDLLNVTGKKNKIPFLLKMYLQSPMQCGTMGGSEQIRDGEVQQVGDY